MVDFSKHLINTKANIKEAFIKLNNVPKNLTLFVLDEESRLVGTLTDGDIRRGFLNGLQLSDKVEKFMTQNYHYLLAPDIMPLHVKQIKEKGIKMMPIIDKQGKIVKVIDFNRVENILPVEAVLMAGGRGERLRPLTDDLPKPLLKLGNKPIIEYNIDLLCKYGVENIYITVKYLAEQIINYFGNGESRNIKIRYIQEDTPLGTIGAVSNIDSFQHNNILVLNSDLFTNINIEDLYLEYEEQKADIIIGSVPYSISIPYAIFEKNENQVLSIKEKPTNTYYANAGIYLMKKEILNLIPKNEFFNATDLVDKALCQGAKVIHFPITGYWFDIGKHEDYNKAKEIVKYIHNS